MNIIPTKYWWSSTEEFPSPLPNETKAESDGSIIGLNIREQRLKAKLPTFDFSCSDSMTDAEKSLIRDRDYLVEQFVKAKNKGGVAFTKWKKENKYFYIPSILLPEDPSVKLAKGNKKGYVSYCMYLAPAKESGFANVCSDSSAQCEAGCLNSAGKGGFDVNVIYARYNKTLLFKYHKQWFYDKLYLEIQEIERKHNSPKNKEYKVPFCIRLNGTSDILWENIKVFKNNKNIFDCFPSIQFYDYTKVLKRIQSKLPNNYDLTLSRSEGEANQRVCAEAIAKGWRIAVVFNRGKELYHFENINGQRTKVSDGYEYNFPKTWHGYKVIDGDETDLRFLDAGGIVVGLSIKGNKQKKSDKENKKLFFVSPDKNGSFKSAENATIFGINNSKNKTSNMPKFKKGSKEAKAYMAKLRNMRSVGATLYLEKGETSKTKPKRIVQVKRTKQGVFKKFTSISGYKKGTTSFFEEGERTRKGGILVKRRKRASASGREGTFKNFKTISGVPSSMGAVGVAIGDVKKHSDLIAYYKDHIEKTKNYLKANSRSLDMRTKAAMKKDIAEHMKTIAHHKKMLSQAKKMIK
jgi:hypothetical protein